MADNNIEKRRMGAMKNNIFPYKKLGFGFMRLPTVNGVVDTRETAQMIHTFIDNGYSYIDTAPGYMNGKSEEILGQLTNGVYPRDFFAVATKLPAWDSRIRSKQEAQNVFWNSLKNMKVDYVDYYLFHNMGEERNEYFDKYDLWEFVAKNKQEGNIRYFGISFHDKADKLYEILESHKEIEFVQLQINYADWNNPFIQAKECYEVAKHFGKPIVVMEPIKGGILAEPPEEILKLILNKTDTDAVGYALDFVRSLPECKMILSGMSNEEQMRDNVRRMENPCNFGNKKIKILENIQQKLAGIDRYDCTSCRYCIKECPQNIVINEIIHALNIELMYNNTRMANGKYAFQTRNSRKASLCVGCGQCERVCPQHLQIRKLMKLAANKFESK